MIQRVRQISGIAVLFACLAVSLLAVVLTSAAPRDDSVLPPQETNGAKRRSEDARSPQDIHDFGGRLTPLPATYRVVEHVLPESSVRTATGPRADEQVIYSDTHGTMLYRLYPGRAADDIITQVTVPCALHEVRVRVSGGVEGGGGEFMAEVTLYDGCPDSAAGGDLIPGAYKLFTQLDDDSAVFHDLVLDFRDRGVCGDGSECQVSAPACTDGSVCASDPLMVSGGVWLRIGVNTPDAGVVVGTPPSIGFSADAYQHSNYGCRVFFGGWPVFAHASFWIEMIGAPECGTHHLSYLAATYASPPILPAQVRNGESSTRLGDDIRLAVDDCTLSAFEIGSLGTGGPYEVSVDLRWPDLDTVLPGTERTFSGLGAGELEVARFTIPEEISLVVDTQDQPLFLTWAVNNDSTGVATAFRTDAGYGTPAFYIFDTDPDNPEKWTEYAFWPTVDDLFHAAIYCRGEPAKGACCTHQAELPGADINCLDAMPITSCAEVRWLEDTTCEENLFDPPCGAHICCLPDGKCQDLSFDECTGTCDDDAPPISCTSNYDCPPGRTCGTDTNTDICTPECGHWGNGAFCSDSSRDCTLYCGIDDLRDVAFADSTNPDDGDGGGAPPCAIDSRQPHAIDDAASAAGWDRMIMSFDCEPFRYHFEDIENYIVRSAGDGGDSVPLSALVEGPPWRVVAIMEERIDPGTWTCVEYVPSGREWCAGYLPGDANQDRLSSAADINALIDSMNNVPGRILPPYATDIDRSGVTNASDILRLIDLLNGADEFDAWLSRSLPPCPTAE